jgi:hypothetical protein
MKKRLFWVNLAFDSNPLTVPLTRRSAFNVLFSGYNDQIHDGLLSAMLYSLSFVDGFDEVIYFNARGVAPGGAFSAAAQCSVRASKCSTIYPRYRYKRYQTILGLAASR